ncbi:DUF4255 domain-containing protein [Persicimonas caeni]|uniref:DUF4255 domain-containing protein n=1 Tax=Persicimonas caeni TaxID=2292766 RepID=A0A4Y6PV99_PERCE|nr:Pvc16 family protein [Persicimonas caeni]QDG52252.1 DUF4255 domain-containing protein [Persicimonas caeni]QED33474.1 DUF4255 domain-containing protein [Persicimonas caeni]
MSDYHILHSITLHLRDLLFEGLAADATLKTHFTQQVDVSLESPATLLGEGQAAGSEPLSLYLYQVVPNAHLNNRPKIPAGPGTLAHVPTSLDLLYLLTPLHDKPEVNLRILAKSVQILAAHPVISEAFLDSDLRPRRPEVRLLMQPLDLEGMTRIWNAFNRPYRLSLGYMIRPVSIDSLRPDEELAPVRERLVDVHRVEEIE